jgi:Fe-S cluster biogenesis protein NfuA
MAEVTLRQGIEPTLRRSVPDAVGIVDVTNHTEGRHPFFTAEKR